ncbi:hypothetical protein MMC25_008219 [Agyrium rufum]|nr:hypothetical protein [Agyrium rufum]
MEAQNELESKDISIDARVAGQSDGYSTDVESQSHRGEDTPDTTINEKVVIQDPNVVDWNGPEDPENPMNWSASKKITAVGIVSLITMLSPLASTIIAPAVPDVLATFHSSNETAGAFVTSVYILGYCFGPLVIAPLSELYGRAILYNICNFIFMIFSIACALSNSLGTLIMFRLLAGIAASSPITLGAGTIADMVPMEKRGLAMAAWILGPLLGPAVGPLAGGYLAQAKGWRWIFWLLTIVAGVVWVACMLLIRESYAYVILQKKTIRLRKETGNMNLRSALDTGKSPKDLFKFSISRPLKMLVFSPIVFLLSLYMALVYGTLYLLFTTFPRVFGDQYAFSNGSIGLTYLGTGIGSMVGLFICAALSDRLVAALTKRNGGTPKPEYRIPVMAIGALLLPTGLLLYGWSAEAKVQWIVPIIGAGFLGAAVMTIFIPGATYLVDTYTVYAASVSAASTVFRSLLGALLPLAGDSMYNALGIGWGTSVLGFIAVAFLPLPLIFWRFGERIRESKISQVQF